MKRIINTLLVFSIGLSLGVILQFARASEEQTKPAYLIVSSERNAGVDYGPYQNAAGPLARNAGLHWPLLKNHYYWTVNGLSII